MNKGNTFTNQVFHSWAKNVLCPQGGGAHTSLTTVNVTVPSWHSLKGAHVWSVLFCDIVLLKLLKGCTSTRAVYRAQARLSPQSMDSMASVSTNALRPGVEWLSATARLAVVNYISCCLIIISKILEMPPCTVSKSRHWRGLIVRKAAIAAVSVCARAPLRTHTVPHAYHSQSCFCATPAPSNNYIVLFSHCIQICSRSRCFNRISTTAEATEL